MAVLLSVLTGPVLAETLRVATWAGDFSRNHPGMMLRELLGDAPVPGLATLREAAPDVILLTDIDFDAGLATLSALRDRIGNDSYPHLFATRPNTGMATGRDLDGDGRLGGPRDAQGYGWFSGQGGMAILSRWPVRLVADYSALLWRDLPDTALAPQDAGADIQRLSSAAHWAVELSHPEGSLTLLTLAATPPVFDGPEDRNGRRNRDEVLLWTHALDGRLGARPEGPLVLMGHFNIDPEAGEGRREAIRAVLAHPRLQDPLPGTPTAAWAQTGPLRVSYVLPSKALRVTGAGLIPPAPEAGPHHLVWVDLALP